ncbi:MAG: hypothetical protein K2Y42_00280 [Hyphomicrobium sp.]|jgi:hypothetical protein|uniref:hypothetical protein n=1 Tax=Hyphomicrobium sp. TaxID=82 RepID=UPI0025B86AB3|nr:hypothetical protein [Hyphomicrobium sp.]MBX9861160.1 hypothetical protein [Hyphomicrobium sp.]
MSTEPPPPVWPPEPTPPHADTTPQQHADTPAPIPMTAAEQATERAAFAELIAFVAQHKDADTTVTHVSADEYASTLE